MILITTTKVSTRICRVPPSSEAIMHDWWRDCLGSCPTADVQSFDLIAGSMADWYVSKKELGFMRCLTGRFQPLCRGQTALCPKQKPRAEATRPCMMALLREERCSKMGGDLVGLGTEVSYFASIFQRCFLLIFVAVLNLGTI